MFASEKNKLIAAGLALTLFGGVVGAYTAKPKTSTAEPAPVTAPAPQPTPAPAPVATQPQTVPNPDAPVTVQLPPGQGYQITPLNGAPSNAVATTSAPARTSRTRTYVRSSAPQRTYYTYEEAPQKSSFWNRHRDILTVGIGTGVGAAIGGLAGGKKGAAIGALAGGGGSALYTYGIRKRH
ncbi:MAG: hypothetical protein K1Y36_00735 [Blastocatellia bacterium]|nr:hypothetical protein [Blastocatellia bacterium]